MNAQLMRAAVAGLRWVLGLVVFVQSVRFALSPADAHQFGATGLPRWLPPTLGGSEALAAVLFLVPITRLLGGYALLFIFAIAVAIHLLHGQFDVGGLLIYGMAVFVCMTYRRNELVGLRHDR